MHGWDHGKEVIDDFGLNRGAKEGEESIQRDDKIDWNADGTESSYLDSFIIDEKDNGKWVTFTLNFKYDPKTQKVD